MIIFLSPRSDMKTRKACSIRATHAPTASNKCTNQHPRIAPAIPTTKRKKWLRVAKNREVLGSVLGRDGVRKALIELYLSSKRFSLFACKIVIIKYRRPKNMNESDENCVRIERLG